MKSVEHEIIRRLFYYLKQSGMNLQRAFEQTMADAQNLEGLAVVESYEDLAAVAECLIPEFVNEAVVQFAEKYDELDGYDDWDLETIWETWCDFEGLDEELAEVVQTTICEATEALNEEGELNEEDDDGDDEVFTRAAAGAAAARAGAEHHRGWEIECESEWDRLSPESRQLKVSTFLKMIGRAGRNARDNQPFIKSNPIGDSPLYQTNAFSRSANHFGYDTVDQDDAGVAPEVHPLHTVAASYGFKHSHTTNVTQTDGSTVPFHSWVSRTGHTLGAYADSDAWSSKVSDSSGHSHSGQGADELDRHLASKARRYKNESRQLPTTSLHEGLAVQPESNVARYLKALDRQSLWSAEGWASRERPNQILREVMTNKTRQAERFNDGMPLTDAEVRAGMRNKPRGNK